MISERDILGTQLIRRNDEVALLYEKIKIQQSTLYKGEAQYGQRLEDIRVLKLEIRKLRRERLLLQKSVANVEDLKWVSPKFKMVEGSNLTLSHPFWPPPLCHKLSRFALPLPSPSELLNGPLGGG